MRMNARNQGQIKTDEVEIEELHTIRYLRSYASKDGTIVKEIITWICSVAASFKTLYAV